MFVCGGIGKRFWFESGKFCDILNPFFPNYLLTSPPGKTTYSRSYTHDEDDDGGGDKNYENCEN